MIEIGSRWTDASGTQFLVIHCQEVNGKMWVYYRINDKISESCEFSCYEESFLERFTEYTN